MNVVILGAGLVGWQLARQLVSEGKEVTLIEKDPDLARRTATRLDCQVITGEGNNLSVLKDAGIENAQFFISATESDEINMISCSLVAAEYTEPVTVARVRNLSYSSTRMFRQHLYGIDHIINPEVEAAKAVIQSLEHGAVGTVNPFHEFGLSMTSISIDKTSPFVGHTVSEIRSSIEGEFLVPLLIRDSNSFIPTGDTTISSGDMIYVFATPEMTDILLSKTQMHRRELRRIAIVGGGRIGCYVADYLLGKSDDHDSGINPWARMMMRLKKRALYRNVHFIEKDYEKARELAEIYPNALITNTDISDEEITDKRLLENYDLLVSATGSQELNLVSAMHAKNLGISRVIALVNKASYVNIAREMRIDVAVSVVDTMVDGILKIIRKGHVHSVHTISGSDFEIIDFLLDANSPMIDVTVQNLKLPKNSLILVVNRANRYIIPSGELVILAGDRIVMITARDSIKKIEQAVAGE